jgi:hypothetical protein
LLLLPDNRTILVDAGFHMSGVGAFKGNELAEQIIADVEEATGKARIDVIVATHRHQDHVYAFNSDRWSEVEVGEVWLPWVEDPEDEDAVKLWKKKTSFAMQLEAAAPALPLSDDDREEIKFILWNAGLDQGIPPEGAMAAWSNAGALRTLRDGFQSRTRPQARFLPESEEFQKYWRRRSSRGCVRMCSGLLAILISYRNSILGPTTRATEPWRWWLPSRAVN